MSIRYRLAHYEITDELGHGGMGVVYHARDTLLGRSLAIKVLPTLMQSDPERRGRFVREARAAAGLNHPNIATVYEVGEAQLEPVAAVAEDGADVELTRTSPTSCLYIAMEYVPGEDLYKRLSAEPMAVEETLKLAVQMADALEVAHQAGVIHRDLKPRNIRVTPEGRVKILDFGLAKVLKESAGLESVLGGAVETVRTMDGMIVGTVPYMAPEQVEGKDVDARSDLFALGVVLYQMLTGHVPFDGSGLVQYVRALSTGRPKPASAHNPAVPKELDAIVARLLARESGERYATAGGVLQALREVLGSGEISRQAPVPVYQPSLSRGPSNRGGRIKRSAAFVLTSGLILGALGYFFYQRGRESSEDDLTSTLLIRRVDSAIESELEGLCRQAQDGFLEFFSPVDTDLSLSLESASDQTLSRDGLALAFRCGLEAERPYAQLILSTATSAQVLWSHRFQPRGGFGDGIWAETAFMVDRAVRVFRYFRGLDTSQQGFRAASLYLETVRRIEQSVRPQDALEGLPLVAEAGTLVGETPTVLALRNELLWRARRILDEDQMASMLESSERAVTVGPEDLDAQLATMRSGRLFENIDESIRIGQHLVERFPRVARAHHELGTSFWWNSDMTRGEEQYFEAVKLRRGFWRYWNDLASLRKAMGDLEGSLEALEMAASLAPPEALWTVENLAVANLAVGDLATAKELLDQIAEHEQTGSVASNLGAVAYLQGRFEQALTHYERAVRLESENPRFVSNLGDAAWMAGDRERAVDSYRTAANLIEKQFVTRGWGLGPTVQNLSHAISLAERAVFLAKAGECDLALPLADTLRTFVFVPEPDPSVVLFFSGTLARCDPTSADLESTVKRALRGGILPNRILLGVEFQNLRSEGWFVTLVGT